MVELENVKVYGNLNHIILHFVMDRLGLVIVLEYSYVINVYLRMVDHVAINKVVM